MSIFDWFTNKLADALTARLGDATISKRRAYRLGEQPRQLRVREGQYDDNISLNLTGLIASRQVSTMLGGGIDFRADEEGAGDDALDYIERVWDANRKEILLQRAALAATEAGTSYLLITPAGIVGEDGQTYPRLTLLDPLYTKIVTDPEDYEVIRRYVVEYRYEGEDGKERSRRRTFQRTRQADGGEGDTWEIITEQSGPETGNRYAETDRAPWPFDFPPVVHWQNLPSVGSVYGEPDISDDVIRLQDRINFLTSNVSKIVRLYAHPMRYGVNIGNIDRLDAGPDAMLKISGDGTDIKQLPPVGDMPSAQQFLLLMRQSMFAITQTVDLDSFSDKIGSLTNFGLRVLYQDMLARINAKRELMGDALEEINRRLLILAGMQPIKTEVVWPDPLPVNETEALQADQALLNMGIISKQTIAERRGLTWEQEAERMETEKAAGDNIGAALLRGFNAGSGA